MGAAFLCVDIGRKRYRRNKFIDLIARNTIAIIIKNRKIRRIDIKKIA
jgi:hypothetical protein